MNELNAWAMRAINHNQPPKWPFPEHVIQYDKEDLTPLVNTWLQLRPLDVCYFLWCTDLRMSTDVTNTKHADQTGE